MKDETLECEVDSSEQLARLYSLFDNLGLAKRYSEEMGELEIAVHGEWAMFFVSERQLRDEAEYRRWADDADRVAEGYWRQ